MNIQKIYSYTACSKQVLGDLHTPVSIYLKVRDVYPESVLLESSDFHASENSLSFIALRPMARVGINSGICTSQFPDGRTEEQPLNESFGVSEALNGFMARFRVTGKEANVCGVFGYTAFDTVRYLEKIAVIETHQKENDAPDLLYILYKYILVFNHYKDEMTLIELTEEGESPNLEELENLIANRNYASYDFRLNGKEHSPITDEKYREMCARVSRTASGAMCSRWCCRGGSNNPSRVMTSRCTEPFGVSTPPRTSSILISVDSGSSVPHQKPTVKLPTDVQPLIRSQEQSEEAATWCRTRP